MRLSEHEKGFLLFRLSLGSEKAPGDCQLWEGGTNDRGYGTISIQGRNYYVHRVSYALFKGPIPEGRFVCHTCDVKTCINPDHLFLGTAEDNHVDMREKGRAFVYGKWLPPSAFEICA